MRTLQRAGAGLLALTLATGIAACGSDDDDEASPDTTVAAGDNAAFCDAVVDFNAVVFQVDISEDTPKDEIVSQGEEIAPLFDTVAEEAPAELADAAAELNTTIQALTEGDAEGFNSDGTFEQYLALVDGAIDECGYETVDVTGVDYAYEGMPDTIDAGTVAFSFTNASEVEDHMMGIIRKKDGVTLTFAELLDLPEDEGEEMTEFLGEAFGGPGVESSALATLTPGSYALICFIPVGGEDGPPHFAEGMIHEFTVS